MSEIDAHVHFWQAAALPDNPGVRRIAALHADLTPEAYARASDAEGVVLVQAAFDAPDTMSCLDLARRTPLVKAVIGASPLEAATLSDDLDAFARAPVFRGLRFALNMGAVDRALLGDALAELARQGLVAELLLDADDLPFAAELAAAVPGLSLVLDHGGGPAIAVGGHDRWAGALREAAACPNVAVKLSGLIERAGLAWSARQIRPYLATLLDAFPPSRLLYASNWPMVTLLGSPGAWRALVEKALTEFGVPPEGRAQIFGLAATRIYGLSREKESGGQT